MSQVRWSDPSTGRTVADLLRWGAESWPDRPCMTFGDRTATYGQMWRRAVSVANNLHARGFEPGDTIAIQSQNCPEFLDVQLGASLLGVVTAPVNFHHRGAFLEAPLNLVRARAVIVESSRFDRLEAVAGDVKSLEAVFVHELDGSEPSVSAVPGVSTGLTNELLQGDTDVLAFSHRPKWSDTNVILFTSGTTGPSKAGVASNHYLVTCAASTFECKGATQDDIFWSPLPLYHGNALLQTVLGPMSGGAQGALESKFSVSGFWPRVREVGATQVAILGAQFLMLWNAPRRDDDADNPLKVMYGSPLPPPEIHREFEERFGVKYVTAYGLGEAFPCLVSSVDDPPPPGTAGRPWDRFEVKIVDDEDLEVPDGEIGELVCRPTTPHVMFEGYLNDPEATVRSFRNLWFHSGDYLRKRDDGWYEFVDRKKDAMRRRGENVSSWEVEQAVLAHPKISEAAAFAVPSEVTEDEIMLVVALEAGETMTPEELTDHCAANMPYFAVPRYIEFSDTPLMNDLGKIPKHLLRTKGVTEATWDREAVAYEIQR